MTGSMAVNARHCLADLHVITDLSLQSLHLWTLTPTLNLQWCMKTDFVVPLSIYIYIYIQKLSLISLSIFKKSAINLLNIYFCNNESLRYALPLLSIILFKPHHYLLYLYIIYDLGLRWTMLLIRRTTSDVVGTEFKLRVPLVMKDSETEIFIKCIKCCQ